MTNRDKLLSEVSNYQFALVILMLAEGFDKMPKNLARSMARWKFPCDYCNCEFHSDECEGASCAEEISKYLSQEVGND